MKKILLIISFLILTISQGQNLINNADFELGTIPIYSPNYINNFPENVPNWRQGCDTDPVTGWLLTPDIHTVNAPICYWNAPNNNHTQSLNPRISGTKRYVKCVRGVNTVNNPNYSIRESIIGELTQPLQAGTYNVSLYGSKIPGVGYCSGSGTTYPSSSPGATIEVVLRNSNNLCNSASVVMWTSSQINSIGSWQQSAGSFVIDCATSALNYDRIEFRIKEQNGVNGIFLDDVSLTKVNLNPQISGNSGFCYGNPLTFTGSIAAGTSSQTHLWEIQECTNTGVLIGNTPLYSQWFVGNPSTFTFPSSLNLACNKFYRVKLAPSNNISCEWFEKTRIIKINCLPTLTPSQTQTICSGASVTFNFSSLPVQVSANGALIGTYYSNPIILSPTVTTDYTFTPFMVKSPCNVTSRVIVQNCPTPCFEFNNVLSVQNEPSLYGLQSVKTICLPNVTINGLCSTNENGYHLRIAEFNLGNWTFGPDRYNNWVSMLGPVPSNVNLNSLVLPYVFETNKLYLVGLTVGNGWYSAPPQFFRVANCTSKIANNEDNDVSQELTNIIINPNPTTDLINITFDNNETGKIEIFSFDGKLVFTKEFKEINQFEVSLSEYNNGIYIARITSDGNTVTKKIIKE